MFSAWNMKSLLDYLIWKSVSDTSFHDEALEKVSLPIL